MKDNIVTLLSVSYDKDTDRYSVKVPAGSNVAETAFCMTVVAKCLVRDKVIENVDVLLNYIKKYCEDPQYDELKKDEGKKDGKSSRNDEKNSKN